MVTKELTKEDIYVILFNLETIGQGTYGIIKEVNKNTCIKLYYKDFYDTYRNQDISKLDDEIDLLVKVDKDMNQNPNYQEIKENERKKFEYLSQIGLIKRLLTYKGYLIGIEMVNYTDYLPLNEARKYLKDNELLDILKKIRGMIDDFINHNVFPMDLHLNNILINLSNHDVVFIDLDDCYTRYEGNDYLSKKPLVRESLTGTCYNNYKKIEHKLRG